MTEHVYPSADRPSLLEMSGPGEVVNAPLDVCWLCQRGRCLQTLAEDVVVHSPAPRVVSYKKPDVEEGLCPDCLEWSLVAFDGSLPPGGFWWAEAAKGGGVGCPKCGAVILVESECEFRPASFEGHARLLGIRLEDLRQKARRQAMEDGSWVLDQVARVWRWLVGPGR